MLCVLNAAPFESRWWRFTANHRTVFTDEMRMTIACKISCSPKCEKLSFPKCGTHVYSLLFFHFSGIIMSICWAIGSGMSIAAVKCLACICLQWEGAGWHTNTALFSFLKQCHSIKLNYVIGIFGPTDFHYMDNEVSSKYTHFIRYTCSIAW